MYLPLDQDRLTDEAQIAPIEAKHASLSELRMNQYWLLLDLAADIVSPEMYGHAMPVEVVVRTARILKQAPKDNHDHQA